MREPSRRLKRWHKAALTVAGLFLLYVAFGFLLLPRLIHTTLTDTLAQITHRPVQLAELRIDPLALSVTLRGLDIGTADDPLARFDELHINLSSRSLWHRAYLFSQIRLQAPQLVIAIDREGNFNFQEMLTADSGEPAGDAPVVVVETLEVVGAAIDFKDESRPEPFQVNIATLDFTLHDFTTRRDVAGDYSLHLVTDHGERLDWQGTLQASPFRSKGTLQLGAIRTETLWSWAGAGYPFDIQQGLLDLDAKYAVDLSGEDVAFQLSDLSLALRNLHLLRPGVVEPVMVLPELDIAGLNLDLAERTVTIAELTMKEMQLNAVRQTDGQIDLQTLFTKAPAGEGEEAVAGSAPWQVKLSRVELQRALFKVDDRTTQPAAHWQMSPFNLALRDIELGTDREIDLQLDSGINGDGQIALQGTLVLEPLSADLSMRLAGLDLTAAQSYVQQSLQLRRGLLDIDGTLQYESGTAEPATRFVGDVAVRRLQAVDARRSEEFLRWEKLTARALQYDSQRARLTVAELLLADPYLRFIITPDTRSNFSQIMAAPAQAATTDTAPVAEVNSKPDTLITVGHLRVNNGTLNFSDQSIKPGFSTSIQQLNGTISGLSSKELERADVDLNGKIDRYAPATITGKVNPLSDDAYTDLKFDFRGIEMSSFSPYSGKFAGYKIDKGKLNVELKYLLSKKELKGENRVVIDQLQLGDAVDSPDATGVPIRLAVAILKDANGMIDLDLPISGRIDDPEFHYGQIVWAALKNVLVKVATAPFKALASLMGGSGESASQVSFVAGSATLSAAELDKLGKLAGALSQRPALMLEIRGSANGTDAEAMRRVALEQQLALQAGESRQQKINALYLKLHGKPATSLLPPVAEGGAGKPGERAHQAATAAEAALLASMKVNDDMLRALAQERAQSIIAALNEGADTVAPERIFVLEANIHAEPGEEVIVPLSLQAR